MGDAEQEERPIAHNALPEASDNQMEDRANTPEVEEHEEQFIVPELQNEYFENRQIIEEIEEQEVRNAVPEALDN